MSDCIIDPDKKGGWTTFTVCSEFPMPTQPKVPAIVQAADRVATALYWVAFVVFIHALIGG